MNKKLWLQLNTKRFQTRLLIFSLLSAATAETLKCIYWGIKVLQASAL
ncbi:hypothetical protein [Tumebacillus algifaecis]|nr:hypothetical protein [Tumebacillus algifaecis]